ncbi:MAG: RDD family protein [Gammaproteobacteria bacterium]|nr:MAG: RDD family protein [Gammaproteobacteria bacterium]
MLDTRHSIETPEGIALQLTVAGPGVRGLAYAADFMIRGVVLTIFSVLFGLLGVTGIGLLTIFAFVLEWFYPIFFEVFWHGQTPGKRFMDIKVVNDNATPVTWSSSVVRNLFRVVDFLPLFYITGLVCFCVNSQFKRVGDLAAGTLVIYNTKRKAFKFDSGVGTRVAPMPLELQEQQAIVSFCERVPQLSPQRSCELASILAPVLGEHDQQAVDALMEIGNGIRGAE